MPRLAIVQQPPALLDKPGSIDRIVKHTRVAASQGAEIVVFPEAFIPGYPSWIWRLRPGGDMKLSDQLHARLLANSVRCVDDVGDGLPGDGGRAGDTGDSGAASFFDRTVRSLVHRRRVPG